MGEVQEFSVKPRNFNMLMAVLLFMAIVNPSMRAAAHGRYTDFIQACEMVPVTDRRYPENAQHPQRMNVAGFNQVIRQAQQVYEPEFRKRGQVLLIRGLWNDSTVNAYAYPGKDPLEVAQRKETPPEGLDMRFRRVDIFGGLARHPAMTLDALLMVSCHEIGHHVGGLPVKANSWGPSNEGQSDYFATIKCMRRVLDTFDNAEIVQRMPIDPLVRRRCYATHQGSPQEAAICMRTAMAGLSLASVLGDLNEEPKVSFGTPDRSVAGTTYNGHPAAQCRLDTYFQGALCRVPYSVDMTMDDPIQGACTPDRASGAMGFRPACWFNPKYYERPDLLSPDMEYTAYSLNR